MTGLLTIIIAGALVGLLVWFQIRAAAVPANALLLRELWRLMARKGRCDSPCSGEKVRQDNHMYEGS